ncbi:glycosyltransferase family 2 protein [Desulfohalobiaceae bacterium Ax17]|uniref:glycosyltransferase family 2 protein n=1 Tax=Desulfovulcanus ferrireducens TaxID=2831190 RepID=UPI00207BBDF2|nr:glycosyltransferase family 2 protein [Desulfovulcanus ferrireducens]MBT8763023.1 glycosyltransferase family 2 protein [Desulfovulcanus ferrireducens]
MNKYKCNYLVSIIIPVFNQWQLTKDCLISLKQHTRGENFEVIVVDNGSSDETNTHCPVLGQNLFGQQFKYIRLEENINFGPACNLGAKKAQGYFLFFLNNDTLVTDNWLPPLIAAFSEDKKLGAVGPLLLYPDNTVQHLGVAFSPLRHASHLYEFFPKDHTVVKKRRSLQAITGAAFLIPRALFFQCGSFYIGYRNGFEDVDLCVQIRGEGKRLAMIPESVVFHLTSQTPGRFTYDSVNAGILAKRCWSKFVPDRHNFYLEDGYDFRLAYNLQVYPVLSKSRQYELEYFRPKKFDVAWYMEMIFREPLWKEGYIKLYEYFLKEEMREQAQKIYMRAVKFFPPDEIYLMLSGINCMDEELVQAVRNLGETLKKEMHQKRKAFCVGATIIKKYAQKNDQLLYAAVKEWETQHRVEI